jgi:RNA polymerase sigma-70 factor (ECF subfamily)
MAIDRDTAVRILISSRASLLGYINSLVHDWDLADDVFQEVSILALKKYESLADESHLGGWLRQAARLESLNVLRKRGRSPRLLGEAVLDLLDNAWETAEQSSPAYGLDAVRSCVEKLTADSQHVLKLRYGDGIKGEELARALDQVPNTVYVRLSRIHRSLAKCIAQTIAKRKEQS